MGRATGGLIDWWRRSRIGRPRVDRLRPYPSLPELPERLGRHELAICGPPGAPKWAAFECPCGTGHRITVSLQDAHKPHWRLSEGPSLWPSVDSRGARRCHFWLGDGRITWVKDREASAS